MILSKTEFDHHPFFSAKTAETNAWSWLHSPAYHHLFFFGVFG